ncbi:ankyrin repeat domain-containing protein [Wolbachia endosymbiont of Phyllotreta cruciferae]|uniref:ankyrin repeat domain-containing protein n=1 Tax=Wolbachia endosymbiont of Phyllotreta cruciferae TaxID=2886377 RepID=UPI00209D4CAE|nr:ankyrin repeat domain-containing protein [Wolbachia endosymbiont of Phyllotreta cruciferae]
MVETKEFVEHIIKLTNRQSDQTNEQEPKWKSSTGQRWPSTDDQELEITQLPTSSKDDYYELIKQSLFWINMNLMDNTSNWSLLEKEWVIKAHRSELTKNQEKLIQKLFHIINSRDTSTLQQFLQKTKSNPDLKTVLDLKVGASELTLLHILPTILYSFDSCTLVDCLLKAGAEPNIQDYKGKTPLHYYAATYPVEKKYVDSLVSHGADLNIKDNNGKTPLQIAIDKGTLDVAECFFNLEQKKLYEELNKLIEGTSKLENGSSKYNVQGVEDLKKFLDKNKNNEDLKMILSIRDEENNLEILKDYMYTEVINLLSATQSQLMVTEQETEETYVPHQCLLDIYLTDQLRQLNQFVSKIPKAANIAELQKVVDKAIMSGVGLNLTKDGGPCFTDYILERIGQLEKNHEVASNIVCTLISKGARLSDWNSLNVIDEIELEFKEHKANMIKAHEQCVDRTHKFLKIAKNATNGKLNCAKMDNATFYLEYSEDSIIDVAQVTDGTRDLGLTHGDVKCGRNIVKIGSSEVEIQTKGGIRYYTDLTEGSDIVLTFYTSLGNVDVRLYPDIQNKSKIIVEVSNKEEVLEKFEGHKEELGEDCALGNYYVYDAIEQGYFERSDGLMRPEVISESNNKWAEREELRRVSNSREEIAR